MMIPSVGQKLSGPSGADSLQLDDCIGQGAFGVVFLATDLTTDSHVAVKFPQIYDLTSSEQDEIAAFFNEVAAAKAIEHPNIVRVLHTETETSAGLPYLVMEYVGGGTLREYLQGLRKSKQVLSILELRQWMGQLVEGIEAINQKMLHRDLRPENILLSDGSLKIGDFGLSKLVGAATRTRTFKGGQHVLYMAPEGWNLESNEIQIDMYSLGVVFFEMATLQYPYDLPSNPSDVEALRKMHLFSPPKDLHALRSDLPVGVAQVITRLMAKRAAERFKTWQDVCTVLQKSFENVEDAGPEKAVPVIERLLEATTNLHRKHTREELEAQRVASERKEEIELDEHQRNTLLSQIKSTVDSFNARSSLYSIRMLEKPGGAILFDVKLAGRIWLRFFRVDPPVELRRGTVRYAACAIDLERAGFNYLLVRSGPDDLYGNWQTCHVGNNVGVVHPSQRRFLEPFGFNDPHEFAKEMQHSEGGMHIYTYKFGQGGPEPLMRLIEDYVKRRT